MEMAKSTVLVFIRGLCLWGSPPESGLELQVIFPAGLGGLPWLIHNVPHPGARAQSVLETGFCGGGRSSASRLHCVLTWKPSWADNSSALLHCEMFPAFVTKTTGTRSCPWGSSSRRKAS